MWFSRDPAEKWICLSHNAVSAVVASLTSSPQRCTELQPSFPCVCVINGCPTSVVVDLSCWQDEWKQSNCALCVLRSPWPANWSSCYSCCWCLSGLAQFKPRLGSISLLFICEAVTVPALLHPSMHISPNKCQWKKNILIYLEPKSNKILNLLNF